VCKYLWLTGDFFGIIKNKHKIIKEDDEDTQPYKNYVGQE